ncbi:MAG: translation initiation factor IF-2 subunit beta [Candidatus Woesearchaeota archaeon]
MDYEEMLTRLRDNLPESSKNRERFEILKVTGRVEGNKTMVTNFSQICDLLGRDQKLVWKYILKELATPGTMEQNRVIFGRKVSSSLINEKIKKFADAFVICPECGKPETHIEKEGNLRFLRCQACGAKTPVKGWLD